jgi:hypothetical protein
MRLLTCFLFVALFAWACHSHRGAAGNGVTIGDSMINKIQGAYSGKFGKGLISLVINYLDGNIVSGYDVHAGHRRNLNGEMTQQGKLLSFVLREPGGNPTDGRFEFVLDPDSMKLDGKWIPFDTTKASAHKFSLARGKLKHLFEYDVWGGVTSNDTLLTFKSDGTCIFAFYKKEKATTDSSRPATDSAAPSADSTSSAVPENPTNQLTSVRGNYLKKGLTYEIEWEKNPYIPLRMTLVKQMKAYKADDGTTSYYAEALKGNGFTFTPPEGDGDEEE